MKIVTFKIAKKSENFNPKNLDETQTSCYQLFVRFLIYFIIHTFHYQQLLNVLTVVMFYVC